MSALSSMENHQKKKYFKWSLGILGGGMLFFICLMLALLICFLSGDLCKGISSRDFHSLATITGFAIGLSSLWVAGKEYWTTVQMLASLILVECMVFYLIGFFIGSYGMDSTFIHWFVYTNTYIALPWLIGLGVGKLIRKRKPIITDPGNHEA